MVDSIIKNIISDRNSLGNYLTISLLELSDIKRHLFLLARSENKIIPDQHYHLLKEKELGDINSLEELLSKGLYKIAKPYLELRERKIFVQQCQQTQWQELITYIPPLILQSAYLAKECKPKGLVWAYLQVYYTEYILPNFKYSALPYPFIPQLDLYVQEQKGLHDLHMHLNGSTETDVIWQEMLQKPDEVYNSLKAVFEKEKVREQYEQETTQFTPLTYLELLKTAQRIRRLLFDFIFPTSSNPYADLGSDERILEELQKEHGSQIVGNYKHPFQEIVSDSNHYKHMIAVESLMYILVFDYLEKPAPKPIVAKAFHFYLLILGLTNRLLVQQIHQNGFNQFQKITLNDIRWFTEQDYKHRFKQLHGNELRNLKFLEGRFAPQATEPKTISLLNAINDGWKDLKDLLNSKNNEEINTYPKLRLTAHFIKQIDDKKDEFIRHKNLRKQTWEKSFVLSKLLANNNTYRELITAADAASNEFDAPPEVFSPILRDLRRRGIRHFTYHAGEDFFHIICGMRAVYEAYTFSEFGCGDRIGHATALGLNPQLWVNNLGKKMLIRQGEWLDDLVFVYHIIVKYQMESLKKYIPFINNEIQELHFDIYGKHETVSMLEKAWLARKWCTLHLLAEEKANVLISFGHNEEEWDGVSELKKDKDCLEIVVDYHKKANRNRYEKIIEIKTEEFLVADLKEMQLAILKEMHEKEIVIETLPTSNVRIGHHKDYSTHQLWNWLNWEEEGKAIPPIVMGSDDTGIFATSIYNEYANLYCCATQQLEYSHNKIMTIIEKLDRNGRVYRFD